jgi:hypothetical protein
MGDVVNLKAARKARERAEARAKAAARATLFGRSRAEKARETAEAEAAERKLDGHHLRAVDPTDPAT